MLVRWYATVFRKKVVFTYIHPEICHAVGSRCSDRLGNVLGKDRGAVSFVQAPLLSGLAKKTVNFLQMLVSCLLSTWCFLNFMSSRHAALACYKTLRAKNPAVRS